MPVRPSKRVAAHLRRLRRECGSWEWVSIDIRERTGNEFGKAYLCRVGNETQAASQRLKDALFPPKPKVSKPRRDWRGSFAWLATIYAWELRHKALHKVL